MSPLTVGTPVIRALRSTADLEDCVRLQEEVWGRGFSESVGVSLLKACQRFGGIVGGAFDGSAVLAGFVFGLTGFENDRPAHWSHMLAVRPGLRDGGLGRRLKAWQRERCLELGVRRMYWTFDPLVSRNGWLNLGRLGVVSREYVEDMYGDSDSPLHQGLGTDRLVATWLLDGRRTADRLHGRGVPPPTWDDLRHLSRAFRVGHATGPPRPGPVVAPLAEEDAVLVPIPADIHEISASDPGLAAAWRIATRRAMGSRMALGWEVRELVRAPDGLSYYLLRPGEAEE